MDMTICLVTQWHYCREVLPVYKSSYLMHGSVRRSYQQEVVVWLFTISFELISTWKNQNAPEMHWVLRSVPILVIMYIVWPCLYIECWGKYWMYWLPSLCVDAWFPCSPQTNLSYEDIWCVKGYVIKRNPIRTNSWLFRNTWLACLLHHFLLACNLIAISALLMNFP